MCSSDLSYVTKRMVNPRLRGWKSNVMDHHYSKDMYFLKPVSEAAVTVEDPAESPLAPGSADTPTDSTAEDAPAKESEG